MTSELREHRAGAELKIITRTFKKEEKWCENITCDEKSGTNLEADSARETPLYRVDL